MMVGESFSQNSRAISGYAIIAKGDVPKQIEPNVFTVPSQFVLQGCKLKKDNRPLKAVLWLECELCIYNWINKYISILSEYVSTLESELSDIWYADEMAVNIHGT
ncbi:MAG TPA: hypothetical protein ENG72_00350 [Thermococcus sp.]|nr:hypothetical protein [Thermococcus sp.]